MQQINYISDRDELEIVFKEVEVPEVVTLKSGISLEFDTDTLSAIILPNFFQMIHKQPTGQEKFELIDFTDDAMKLQVDHQTINVKLNLTEI